MCDGTVPLYIVPRPYVSETLHGLHLLRILDGSRLRRPRCRAQARAVVVVGVSVPPVTCLFSPHSPLVRLCRSVTGRSRARCRAASTNLLVRPAACSRAQPHISGALGNKAALTGRAATAAQLASPAALRSPTTNRSLCTREGNGHMCHQFRLQLSCCPARSHNSYSLT
jgi:hypothetical protein